MYYLSEAMEEVEEASAPPRLLSSKDVFKLNEILFNFPSEEEIDDATALWVFQVGQKIRDLYIAGSYDDEDENFFYDYTHLLCTMQCQFFMKPEQLITIKGWIKEAVADIPKEDEDPLVRENEELQRRLQYYEQHLPDPEPGSAAVFQPPSRRPKVAETSGFSLHTGPVHLIDGSDPAAVTEFRQMLETAGRAGGIWGFDIEWAPDRFRGQDNPVAMLQLAHAGTVWLVRTCFVGRAVAAAVSHFLLDPAVVKVTVGFDSADLNKLWSSFGTEFPGSPEAYGVLDVGAVAKGLGLRSPGLKAMAKRYGYNLIKDKTACLSDWSARQLAQKQLQYAADDAHFPLLIAAGLLQEPQLKSKLTPVQLHARDALEAVLSSLKAAVSVQQKSEEDLAKEATAEDVAEFLLTELGSAMVPLNTAQSVVRAKAGLELLGRIRESGFGGLGFSFFETFPDLFAIRRARDGKPPLVRPKAYEERLPQDEQALALPWANDTKAALQEWVALECGPSGACATVSAVRLEEVLRARLTALARLLEDAGDGAGARSASHLTTAATDVQQLWANAFAALPSNS